MPTAITLFLGLLSHFRPIFRETTFYRFVLLVIGWILTPGRHAVTSCLIALGISGTHHHAAFHRFFSKATWSVDELGKSLLPLLLTWMLPGALLTIIIDDTFTPRKGPKVFGRGSHIDAVRSSKKYKVLSFGHCWVVLSLSLDIPILKRRMCFPILFRLYQNKKYIEDKDLFKTKLELASEMMALINSWVGNRPIRLLADGAYCNTPTFKNLPPTVKIFGRLRIDAALRGPLSERVYAGRGCRPKYGNLLPNPKMMAADPDAVWETSKIAMYGEERTISYQTAAVRWSRVFGENPIKMVVVKPRRPEDRVEAFFSTDLEISAEQLLHTYSLRWDIEVSFRDLKQFLGLKEYTCRTKKAVQRIVPFIGLLYSLVILWFAKAIEQDIPVVVPLRPWYRTRKGPSFEDMLRTLQHSLRSESFLKVIGNMKTLRMVLCDLSSESLSLKKVA